VLRVLHLVGSAQSEFMADLSRLYARDCLETVGDPERYEPLIAHVDPDGSWRFPADLDDPALSAASRFELPLALGRIAARGIDVMVPHMFCLPGMTTYRALFDALGIRYVGNRPTTMALGAHKARAKAIVAGAGVDVARGELLRSGERTTLPLPVVVKPVAGDNSDGLTLVREAGQLPQAIAAAAGEDGSALVEQYVPLGREVRCGILERRGELTVLPLEEYAVSEAGKPIRDAGDKLRRDNAGELELVAKQRSHAWTVDPADPICTAVAMAALACHEALGCRHYSLFDFRITPDGRPIFLEAGLYCSFARQSVLATMACAAGIDTPELFAQAVATATSTAPIERSRS
jgi:D-alanine-D-alanine ligase